MSELISLSIIIPAFNEEKTILNVINKLIQELSGTYEIIVVDDGSVDKTRQIVQEIANDCQSIRLISQPVNRGKTAALETGFKASTGKVVIVQDADLEYNPEDIPNIIYPIQSGQADVVYGSRFLVRKVSRVLYFRHYVANRLITFFSNVFTDLNLTDVETGYKAFKGDLIRDLNFTSSRFGFEIEVTAKISKLKCRIYEVPISYYGRTYEEGKKIGWRDGLWAFYYILRYNLF